MEEDKAISELLQKAQKESNLIKKIDLYNDAYTLIEGRIEELTREYRRKFWKNE